MRIGLLIIGLLLLSFIGYGQNCTLSVELQAPGTAICSGTSIVLTAAATGGTGPYVYSWSTGETTQAISVNKAGTYTVTVSDNTAGCQPISKSITITSTITPNAPSAGNVAVCQNTTATLTATAPGGVYQWYDSGGKYLYTGDTYTTPPISQLSAFYVETTVNGCVSPRTTVYVFVYGPPAVGNVGTCQGNPGTLTANGYPAYIWYDAPSGGNQLSAAATYTTPALSATTTYYVAGIINGCTTARAAATVFVTAAPQPPAVSPQSICTGSAVTLHADAPAGNIDWFAAPTGGTSLITSPDFTTPPLTATTTYYAQVTTGCVSQRTPVTVTVTQIPAAPAIAPVSPVCPGGSAHLVAPSMPGIVYEWYSRSAGGTLLATGDTYDTPVLNRTATYYVQANNSGCVSARTLVRIPITTPPEPPTAEGALICPGTGATLTATAPGGSYQWYDAATGGNLLSTDPTFNTPALTVNTTYYVQATAASGCVSERTAVDVTLYPVTAPPSVTAVGPVCSGTSATLTATGAANYQWYDAATGGTLLSDTQALITPVLTANTTYYVQTTAANGCVSTRTAITVIVNPIPNAPTGNGTQVCTGTPATISASAPIGTIAWYDAPSGGNLMATGNSYTTPPLANTTTFYAEATNGSCASARIPVVAAIITGANPQFQYDFNTICAGTGLVKPVINNPAGGVFSASPAGLAINPTTGEINTNISLQGTYTISFANNGPCPAITSTKFTIGSVTDATFSYNTPFCQDGINPNPIFPGQYSAGTFTSAPAGLVFVNTSTGEVDLAKSTPGTYTITNTIGAGGACPVNTATFSITINQKVTVTAGANQTAPAGAAVQLAGSVTGGTNSGVWSGGNGTFSNPISPTAVYTPATGETTTTLTLTSADPPGPCGPQSAQVVISFSPAPPAPTVKDAVICTGNSTTLTATAPGGAYNWYTTATGGTPIFTGASFTTPTLTTTTIYYVAAVLNGGTSARTAVTATVTPIPAAPIINATSACMGSRATLNISNPAAATYNWYNVASGGNILGTGTTFTTRRLNANATYYAEAVNNSCTSIRTPINITVNPLPAITSADAGTICSGAVQNYTITADNPSATFVWARALVTGISNLAVSGQTAATITEALVNTTNTAVDVTYSIIATINGCSSATFNYTVTVYPNATVTSPATIPPICNGTSSNYTITFNTQVSLSWSRSAVEGISNAAVSGQATNALHEILFNTTNAPVNVTYVFNYNVGSCTNNFNLVVTVNPGVNITSATDAATCSGFPQSYAIQSNIPSATFTWSRPAVAGNPAVSGQTASTITEALVNTTSNPIAVNYTIVPTAFNCSGGAFNYRVVINPIPVEPVANGNSPVCVNSVIQLRTPTLANASYLWTGPNGYTSTSQNPDIPASLAAAGNYSLVVIVNGCSSPAAIVPIAVDTQPLANAGPDQTICISAASIQLAGDVTGGTITGVWASSGSGTFSPANNVLNAQYIPSSQDKLAGKVTLTLVSTSKDDCAVSSDDMIITFGLNPASDAGIDQDVCAQVGSVPLNGTIIAGSTGQWSTSGSGTFSPSATQLNAAYLPSAADIASGKVTLSLNATNAGTCYKPDDAMVINFIPPPAVNAGGIRYVLKGNTITLNPVVSDENVKYAWSPNIAINDTNAKNPVITGDIDRVYFLTVTDIRGCTSSSQVAIKVSPILNVPNTFTPNGDGTNDTWKIAGLTAYENASIDIFNRNGQKLFHSIGYPTDWDGNFDGKPVPVGVYYYIIDTKTPGLVLTGYVTVIR